MAASGMSGFPGVLDQRRTKGKGAAWAFPARKAWAGEELPESVKILLPGMSKTARVARPWDTTNLQTKEMT
jgi:hypothetical protein